MLAITLFPQSANLQNYFVFIASPHRPMSTHSCLGRLCEDRQILLGKTICFCFLQTMRLFIRSENSLQFAFDYLILRRSIFSCFQNSFGSNLGAPNGPWPIMGSFVSGFVSDFVVAKIDSQRTHRYTYPGPPSRRPTHSGPAFPVFAEAVLRPGA